MESVREKRGRERLVVEDCKSAGTVRGEKKERKKERKRGSEGRWRNILGD